MRVLVFGKTGQVAREIAQAAGIQAVTLEAHGRDTADFTDPDACAQIVAATDANAVINAVAYTAVDKAEGEEPFARTINAHTPSVIAQACAARDLPLIHISTDYVFDGAGDTPFGPDDPTAPLGAYGRSKLAGEQAIRAAGGPHAIFRTSWVVSAHGSNFVKTMLSLGAERGALRIVADQVGGPTPAADIAAACLSAARQLRDNPAKSGTYHLSGSPDVSWADFAREIFSQSGVNCTVKDITSAEYPTLAPRPRNSRLDNARTWEVFGIARPDWRPGLHDILRAIGALPQ